MEILPAIREQISQLPNQPGVYRYYDKNGLLLYIGKAINLKKRVSSYFVEKQQVGARLKMLVRSIYRIEFTVVATEKDAFLLENALIKEHQPKFNVSLKDDKTYPYIKIVDEPIPRIFFTRNKQNDGSEYFGPYTSVHNVRYVFDIIKRIYPIRTCHLHLSQENIKKKKFKVCLEYHIGNCLGPCAAHQTKEDYDSNVQQIRKMLKGKLSEVHSILKSQLDEAVEQLAFERADVLHKRILHLREYISQSTIVNDKLGDMEVFGIYDTEEKVYVNHLSVSEGTIIATKTIFIRKNLETETTEELLAQAIYSLIGDRMEEIEIVLPLEIHLEGSSIKQTIPSIGDKKKLLDLAIQNAHQYYVKDLGKPTKKEPYLVILEKMKEELRLIDLPYHIECFDNSNFQGAFPVSSMSVFKNAKPSTKDYRHYKVETVVGPDDFATMKEVIFRRYRRLLEENKPLPQLIVIDGGKGQLGAAIESLKTLGIYEKVQVISIAKKLEEIYYPEDTHPLLISKKSTTLKVLQHIRNEAHRFGITFHREQRSKGTIKTTLTEIPGIGKTTSEKLLKHFKSVKKLKEAQLSEIQAIMGTKRGAGIFHLLHPEQQKLF
ncbi:MAG: excinuclease ABC subunit UvrC [Chitinophagales bacterium]|nr:excinuclease ABC subunit UvrC [Chitinophagales bacterium]